MNIEEMSTWTVDETLAHVHLSLPKNWMFQTSSDEGFVSAVIFDAEGVEQWFCEEPLPDLRMIYMEAYGWLQSKESKVQHPVWSRRGEVTQKAIQGLVGVPDKTAPVSDPEDVDPEEVLKEVDKQYHRH